jgi:putative tryptophan/tyrosine transport system substrate-binding protein
MLSRNWRRVARRVSFSEVLPHAAA